MVMTADPTVMSSQEADRMASLCAVTDEAHKGACSKTFSSSAV